MRELEGNWRLSEFIFFSPIGLKFVHVFKYNFSHSVWGTLRTLEECSE